jgi:PAT family beta-lactamase induction signal transducer AmpG
MSLLTKTRIGSMSILFGFMAGFVLTISTSTLNFRLAQANTSTITLGLVSIVSLPYALSFILTIYIERLKIPYLSKLIGNKTSILVLLHITMGIAVYKIGNFSPNDSLVLILLTSILVSCAGAIQDNFFGAIRIQMSQFVPQRFISSIYVTGCRLGMICSGPLAIILSTYYDWHQIYKTYALIIFCFPIIAILYLAKHKQAITDAADQRKVLQQLKPEKAILLSLLFVIFYNMPDNMLIPMLNPFLLGHKFTAAEIATSGKLFGYFGAAIGAIVGSWFMQRINILSGLLYFGLLHAVAHSGYAIIALLEKNVSVLIAITAIESITGGMKMAAGVILVTSLCSTGKHHAGNYAFFTSILGLSKAIFPSFSGILASYIPWPLFFVCISFFAIPSLLLIKKLPKILDNATG